MSSTATSFRLTKTPSWISVQDSTCPLGAINDLITKWYKYYSYPPPFAIPSYALQFVTGPVDGRPPRYVHKTCGPLQVTVYPLPIPTHLPLQDVDYIAVAHGHHLKPSLIKGRDNSIEYWIWEVALDRFELNPSVQKIAAAVAPNHPNTQPSTEPSTAASGLASTLPMKETRLEEAVRTISIEHDLVDAQRNWLPKEGTGAEDIMQHRARPSQHTIASSTSDVASNHQTHQWPNTSLASSASLVPSPPIVSTNENPAIRRKLDEWYAAKGSRDTPPCAIHPDEIPVVHDTRDGKTCIYIHKPSGLTMSVSVVRLPEAAKMIPAPTRTYVIIAKVAIHDIPLVIGMAYDTGPVDVWKGIAGDDAGWETPSCVEKILYVGNPKQCPVHPFVPRAPESKDGDTLHHAPSDILTRQPYPLHRQNRSAPAFRDDAWLQDAESLNWWPTKGVYKQPIDLGELKRLVVEKGGPERVKWAEVGREMGYDSADWQTTYVRKRYDRWISLYDQYLRSKTIDTQQRLYSSLDGSTLPSAIPGQEMSDRAAPGPVALARAALGATTGGPTMPGRVIPSPAASVSANVRLASPVSVSAPPYQGLAMSGPCPSPDPIAHSDTSDPPRPQPPTPPPAVAVSSPAVPDQVRALSGHAPIVPGRAQGRSDQAPTVAGPPATSTPSSKAPSLASTSPAVPVALVSDAAPVGTASNSASPPGSAATPPTPAPTMPPASAALAPASLALTSIQKPTPGPPSRIDSASAPATSSVAPASPPVAPVSPAVRHPSALPLPVGVTVTQEHHRSQSDAFIPLNLPSPNKCSFSGKGVEEEGADTSSSRTRRSKSPSPMSSSSTIPAVMAAADGNLNSTTLPSQPPSLNPTSSSAPKFTDTLNSTQTENSSTSERLSLVPLTTSAPHAANTTKISPSGEFLRSKIPPSVSVPSASSPPNITNAPNDNSTRALVPSESMSQVPSLPSAPIVTDIANSNPTGVLSPSRSMPPVRSALLVARGSQKQHSNRRGILDPLKPMFSLQGASLELLYNEKPPVQDDAFCSLSENIRELIKDWSDQQGASWRPEELPCASNLNIPAFIDGLSGHHIKWKHVSGENLTVKMFYLGKLSDEPVGRPWYGVFKTVLVARGNTVPPFIIRYRGNDPTEREATFSLYPDSSCAHVTPYKAWVGVSGDKDGFEATPSVTKYYDRPEIQQKRPVKRPLPTAEKTGPTKSPAVGTPRKLQSSAHFSKERLRPPRKVRYSDIFDVESSEEDREEDFQDDEEDSEGEETDEHHEEDQEHQQEEEEGEEEEEEHDEEQNGTGDDHEGVQPIDWKERAVALLNDMQGDGDGTVSHLRRTSSLLMAERLNVSFSKTRNFWYSGGGKRLVQQRRVQEPIQSSPEPEGPSLADVSPDHNEGYVPVRSGHLNVSPADETWSPRRKIVCLKYSDSKDVLGEQEGSPPASPPAANTRKRKRIENEVERSTENSISSRLPGIDEDADPLLANNRKRARLEQEQEARPAQVLDPPLNGLNAPDLTVPAANTRKRKPLGSDHETPIRIEDPRLSVIHVVDHTASGSNMRKRIYVGEVKGFPLYRPGSPVAGQPVLDHELPAAEQRAPIQFAEAERQKNVRPTKLQQKRDAKEKKIQLLKHARAKRRRQLEEAALERQTESPTPESQAGSPNTQRRAEQTPTLQEVEPPAIQRQTQARTARSQTEPPCLQRRAEAPPSLRQAQPPPTLKPSPPSPTLQQAQLLATIQQSQPPPTLQQAQTPLTVQLFQPPPTVEPSPPPPTLQQALPPPTIEQPQPPPTSQQAEPPPVPQQPQPPPTKEPPPPNSTAHIADAANPDITFHFVPTPRRRPLSACKTVRRLFGHAKVAGIFDEEATFLSIRVNGMDHKIMEKDEEDFAEMLRVLEGFSGVVEVRAA